MGNRLLESESVQARAGFESAAAADRRVAGVSAAARAVRMLVDRGAREVVLSIGGDARPAESTYADIDRLRGDANVQVKNGAAPAIALPSSWQIVQATGKSGDGLVSRWLNRPISQRISWLLLHIPALRPIHVTVVNAVLAALIIVVMTLGGNAGLVAGGILFHFASVLDGVDGEMARATFRTTRQGATLDSAVDMATNFSFLLGLTINLWLRGDELFAAMGIWSMAAMLTGNYLIARKARARGAPLGYDLLKRSGRIAGPADLIYWLVQTLTGRDCFAFLFMVLILLSLEWVALSIFAGVAAIWFPYVLITLAVPPRAIPRKVDA